MMKKWFSNQFISLLHSHPLNNEKNLEDRFLDCFYFLQFPCLRAGFLNYNKGYNAL